MRAPFTRFIPVLMLILAGTALAQPPAPQAGPRAAPAHAQEAPHPVRVVSVALELSEEQVAAFHDLLRDRKEANDPVQAEIDLLQDELDALLKGENPDPAAVGDIVLEIQDLRGELRENQQVFLDGFHALLTEEQSNRLLRINQVALAQRAAEAMREIRLH